MDDAKQERKVRDNMSYLDHVKKQSGRGKVSKDDLEYAEYINQSSTNRLGTSKRYKIWSGIRDEPRLVKIFKNNDLSYISP